MKIIKILTLSLTLFMLSITNSMALTDNVGECIAKGGGTPGTMDLVGCTLGEYSWVGTLGGAVLSSLSAKKHDAMIQAYMERILDALDEINGKIDKLSATTCALYEHTQTSSFAGFRVLLLNYLAKTNKHLFVGEVEYLALYIPQIITKFEDHQNLLDGCGIDQYDSLGHYLLMTNIDLSIQAEYIRMNYYELYRVVNGVLTPLDQMDPVTRTDMETGIERDIKAVLRNRFDLLISHLQVLDGSNANFSWQKYSDSGFTPITLPEYETRLQNNFQVYKYKGETISLHKEPGFALPGGFTPNNDLWVMYTKSGSCFYKNKKFLGRTIVTAFELRPGCLLRTTFNPDIVTIFSEGPIDNFKQEYGFLNDTQELFKYRSLSASELYKRRKHEAYIKFSQAELYPAIQIVQQWAEELSRPLDVPGFNAEIDMTNYVPYQEYCDSRGINSSYEHIQQVKVGNITSWSGNNGGLVDLTKTQPFVLTRGVASPVEVTPGFSSGTYNENWKVWIDADRDGFYSGDEEVAFTGYGNTTVSGSIKLPGRVLKGTTGMRVSMQWNRESDECGSFTWGEVEDYRVTIQ